MGCEGSDSIIRLHRFVISYIHLLHMLYHSRYANIYFNIIVFEKSFRQPLLCVAKFCILKMQSTYTIFYKYNLSFNVEYCHLLSFIVLFHIVPVLSAITAVCFRWCHLVVTAWQEVTSPPSWLPCQNAIQNGCSKGCTHLWCAKKRFSVSVWYMILSR